MSSTGASRAAAPNSLQRRLALELTLALGLLLALLFVALDKLIDRELYARLDATLLNRAQAIATILGAQPGPQEQDAIRRLMPEYQLPGHTDFFAAWDADGNTRIRSPSSDGRDLARPPVPPAGAPVYYDMRLPDGHRGRAVALRVTLPIEQRPQPMTLAVATEREPMDRLERSIHYLLLAGIACAMLLAVAIALLAVRRGLAPVLSYGEQVARHDDPARLPGTAGEPLPRELRPFEAALRSAFERLYATIERERRFSRDVAHELRTPLAEIRSSAEAALRNPADAAATQAALAAAIAAVERMQRAIDVLLQLARFESGLAAPAREPLELGGLAGALASALAMPAAERRQRLELRIAAPLWTLSDAGVLERIVSNLLRNAIEYAPPDSPIRVEAGTETDGIWLCVRNPAPDLDADDLAHFGERFWRKSPAGGSPVHAGLGLALAIGLARSLSLRLSFSLEAGQLVARLGPLPPL